MDVIISFLFFAYKPMFTSGKSAYFVITQEHGILGRIYWILRSYEIPWDDGKCIWSVYPNLRLYFSREVVTRLQPNPSLIALPSCFSPLHVFTWDCSQDSCHSSIATLSICFSSIHAFTSILTSSCSYINKNTIHTRSVTTLADQGLNSYY